jgi:cytochrome P450
VRTDVRLAANAVAEGLRLWPPIMALERYALEDFEFADTVIPQGTVIAMLWAAGNRDPDVYEQPNHYDLLRKPRTETTFGGGIHICAGRYVARMLAQVMLETVLAPDIRIELTGPRPAWLASTALNQLDQMRVSIRRG